MRKKTFSGVFKTQSNIQEGFVKRIRYRANNYKNTHRKFKVPKEALRQKVFHKHFCSDGHRGIQDWLITLME